MTYCAWFIQMYSCPTYFQLPLQTDWFICESKQIMWGTTLLRRETTDLKTRSATKQRKRRRESRTQSGKKRLCASPLCKKNCNRTQTSAVQFKPNRELSTPHPTQPPPPPLSAAISPTANISLQLPGLQNERRFHFTSVISRPVCYLCGDKCLTDWECR